MALIMKALHNIEIDFSRIYMCIYLYVYIIRALTYNNTYIPLIQLMCRNLTHRTFFSNHVFHVIISITFCFLNLSFFKVLCNTHLHEHTHDLVNFCHDRNYVTRLELMGQLRGYTFQ